MRILQRNHFSAKWIKYLQAVTVNYGNNKLMTRLINRFSYKLVRKNSMITSSSDSRSHNLRNIPQSLILRCQMKRNLQMETQQTGRVCEAKKETFS